MLEKRRRAASAGGTVLESEGGQDQGTGDQSTQDGPQKLGNSTFTHNQSPILPPLVARTISPVQFHRAPRPSNGGQPIQGVSRGHAAPTVGPAACMAEVSTVAGGGEATE